MNQKLDTSFRPFMILDQIGPNFGSMLTANGKVFR